MQKINNEIKQVSCTFKSKLKLKLKLKYIVKKYMPKLTKPTHNKMRQDSLDAFFIYLNLNYKIFEVIVKCTLKLEASFGRFTIGTPK